MPLESTRTVLDECLGKRCGASRGYFPIVKYKYGSSVSTSFAPLKVLFNCVVSSANSAERMTASELHAVPEGFPSLSQKKKKKKE